MAYFFREIMSRNPRTTFEMSHINGAYESYSRWLDNGNRDLRLPGFRMTDRQMFWIAAVHVLTEKYQRRVSPIFEVWPQLTNKYMHVLLKNTPEFRKDFDCNAPTAEETQKFEEYQKTASILEKINDKRCPVAYRPKYSDKNFDDFEKSGILSFIESVVTDSENEPDLQEFQRLRQNNSLTDENICKLFNSICYQTGCGKMFLFENPEAKVNEN